MRHTLSLIFVLILLACSNQHLNETPPLSITRIENSIASLDSTAMDLHCFDILNNIFPKANLNDSDFVSGALFIKESPIFTQCISKVDSVFPNNELIVKQLSSLNTNFQSLFNDSLPKIYTVISPYNQSIMIGDDYFVIALNHYLGADEPLYNYFPAHKRRYKEPSRIGIDLSEALIKSNYLNDISLQSDSHNVLSSMIYEGVVMKLMQELNPELSIEDILMWSSEEVKWFKNNEQSVWQYLIANDILYSTDERYIQELNAPSPTHFYASHGAPDMIGRYIGYKVLDGYMKSTKISKLDTNSVNQIFNQLPQQVLITSGYNGK